jgi:anti-sigma B factor antagonist
MEIEIKDYKGVKVITVSGDIDMYSSPALREELIGHINTKISVMLVDFNRVSYIDSSGIATFVEALKHMKTYGGRLRLFGLPGGVKEIFGFSKLDKVFEICGDIEDAIGT